MITYTGLAVVIVFGLTLGVQYGLMVLAEYREDRRFAAKTDRMFAAALGLSLDDYHAEYGKSVARPQWWIRRIK